MKTLKYLVAAVMIVATSLICLPARAQFQPNNIQIICDSGTNHIPFNTTLTTAYGSGGATTASGPVGRIDCGRGKDAGISIEFKQDIAGTTNNFGFVFAKALTQGGSTNYATDSQTIWVAGNGTSLVRLVTNVTVGGVSDYYLTQVLNTNAATTTLTNILVKAHVK